VLYLPEFAAHFIALAAEVERLKERLSPEAYRGHDTVKLFAALFRLVREIIPANPDDPRFRLRGNLAKFRRAKGLGLPSRYRLFWVFSQRHRTIVYLYLNGETTLRKEGASTDPHTVFSRLVARGDVGADFDANLARWQRAYPGVEPPG
jgi:toxin YhaV